MARAGPSRRQTRGRAVPSQPMTSAASSHSASLQPVYPGRQLPSLDMRPSSRTKASCRHRGCDWRHPHFRKDRQDDVPIPSTFTLMSQMGTSPFPARCSESSSLPAGPIEATEGHVRHNDRARRQIRILAGHPKRLSSGLVDVHTLLSVDNS